MKKKFIVPLLVLSTLVFTNVISITQAAGNYSDTSYQYAFSDWQPSTGWNTVFRNKMDYTSSYMTCHAASGRSYSASVMAGKTQSDTYRISVGSPWYTFYAGTTIFMINYVKESSYNYASIQAKPSTSGSYTASGLWSPDSI